MQTGWYILFHILGLGCIAADIAIIAGVGQVDLSWTGWFGVGFCWWVAVGLAMGWKRLVGRPVTLMIFGFYMMATLLLLGVGFSPKMGQPTLLLAFAPMVVALIGRIILDIIAGPKKPAASAPAKAASPAPAKPASMHDSIF